MLVFSSSSKHSRVFFVATAPLDASGHVNVSPKGLDTFRMLAPNEVAYLDYVGSEAETIAHLKENRRIVMMCFSIRRSLEPSR